MVFKIIELEGTSARDFSDAVANAVKDAGKTVRGIERVVVDNLEARVENNRLKEYRARVRIIFRIER